MKTGHPVEIQRETTHLRLLPEKHRPEIFFEGEGRYVMERMVPWGFERSWVPELTSFMEEKIWSQPWNQDPTWPGQFYERFGFFPSEFIREEPACVIHGDPTLLNLMRRSREQDIVLIDPKPPGRGIPSLRSVDTGKMVQSLLGWEYILLGEPLPLARDVHEGLEAIAKVAPLQNTLFWAQVHLMRIRQRTPLGSIGVWAQDGIRFLAQMRGML